MQKLLLILFIINFCQSVVLVRRFVGFGVKVFKDNEQYVPVKEDNEKYLGIVEQGERACAHLQDELYSLQDQHEDISYTFIGISQGGLVARWVFINCPHVNYKVKRIITLGTPNLGIDKISLFYSQGFTNNPEHENYINDYLRQNNDQQLKIAENRLSLKKRFNQKTVDKIAQFYLKLRTSPQNSPRCYLVKNQNGSDLIDSLSMYKLNLPQQASLQDKFNKLELYLNIGFLDENMISPPESVMFGTNIKVPDQELVYTEDAIQQEKEIFNNYYTQKYKIHEDYELYECGITYKKENEVKQCKEDITEQYKKKREILQKEYNKKWSHSKLNVRSYNPYFFKYWFLKMRKSKYLDLLSNKSELDSEQKDKVRGLISKQNVAFADILASMYSKGIFVLCAVKGEHLQFPNYYVQDEYMEDYVNLYQAFDEFSTVDKTSERYQSLLSLFNCNHIGLLMENNNRII